MSSRADRTDRRLACETTAARPHFIIAGGLATLTACVIVAQAALLAHIIASAAFGHATVADLRGSIVALAAVLALRALLSGGFELSGKLAASRVMAELRGRLADKLLIRRPGRAPGERTGELAATAIQGVDALDGYFSGYLPSLALAVTVPIAVLIWVVRIDLVTALILALTIPILITFMILIGLRAQSVTQRRWRTLTLLSSHFLDVVAGLETLRAHRRESAQAETLRTVGENYRRETMNTLRLAFLSALVLELCAMIGTALVAATIGIQLTEGDLTLTAGLTVLLLAPEMYAPLRQVGQQFHASADGLAAAERMLNVLDGPGLIDAAVLPSGSATGPVPDPRQEPLRLENVNFAYPDGPSATSAGDAAEVLHDVTFTFAPAQTVALVGRSGAGKSTVAALALRLADPTAGTVSCGDRDLREVPVSAWRSQTAWVPQTTTLFTGTLAENIALAQPRATPQQILRAAASAGLSELVSALPDGLGTAVGEGGRQLSAGQRQRIALARAFLADAALVVLDEPTANLDPATARSLGNSILELSRGRMMLLITHDRELAGRADQVLELGDGAITPPRMDLFAVAA